MDIVDSYTFKTQKRTPFSFHTGDTVNVHVSVHEGGKERTQVFTGVIIKAQGQKSLRSFTVRKTSHGIGVERTFPIASPAVKTVELVSRSKVRRSRLFYLRKLKGRSARLQIISTSKPSKS